ncbi:hypothetical protein [Bacillus sp. WP8]|uniref:hypothetical protein n=1 Tax=Bacillus sp. WP8 TaxID=756828 RepID=UPI001642BAA7|nr:hypothetical protein [Bacillus sp. WP8]
MREVIKDVREDGYGTDGRCEVEEEKRWKRRLKKGKDIQGVDGKRVGNRYLK